MNYPPHVFSSQHTFALNKMLIGCCRPPSLWTTVQLAITIQGARHTVTDLVQTRILFIMPAAIFWWWSHHAVSKSRLWWIYLFIFWTWTDYTMSPRREWHYVQYIVCLQHIVRARFITCRNYQSAAFEYRIFDRNQHSNIRLTNCKKMHSPIYITQSLAITNPIFHNWLKTLTMLKPPLSCTAIYTWYWLTWRPCHWGQPFFTGMPCRNENFRSLRSNFSSALLRSWRR